MDRTAWIVITLCVIGLVAWEWWTVKHPPPRPAAVALATPTATPVAIASATAAPLASPVPNPTPQAQATPEFAEKTETLRNDDVELRVTNRGGGIRDAVLPNHIAQGDQRVVLNSKDLPPIRASSTEAGPARTPPTLLS